MRTGLLALQSTIVHQAWLGMGHCIPLALSNADHHCSGSCLISIPYKDKFCQQEVKLSGGRTEPHAPEQPTPQDSYSSCMHMNIEPQVGMLVAMFYLYLVGQLYSSLVPMNAPWRTSRSSMIFILKCHQSQLALSITANSRQEFWPCKGEAPSNHGCAVFWR